MRVLVAGGAGMIGSNLCAELLGHGHRVICLDNLATGRLENLAPLLRHPEFEFVQADVVDEMPPFPRLGRIYHLASPASPPGYTRLPIETMRANSEGTRRLLDMARRHSARLLYTSTSEIYGDPERHPQREDYRGNVSSTGPRSMYDESKRYGEAIVTAFVRSMGVDARIVRIFNTYGPGCDPKDGRVVVNLVCQALQNQPMTIYGDGRQTRSLCYVSDLVHGLVRAMEAKNTRGEVVNLGNPDERSVLELAAIVRELTHSSSPIVHRDYEVGDDPHCRRPDIGKAKQLLDWEPKVELRDGLLRTIAYLRTLVPSAAADEARANGEAYANGDDAGHVNGHANGDASGHVSGRAVKGHANGHARAKGDAHGPAHGHPHDAPGRLHTNDSE
jgi:UDP-glucuronate decarboxylase